MAQAKDPQLIIGNECAVGSKRTRPWMLFEDRNGDGYFDYVTVGLCDGSTASRGFSVMPADPWELAPGDTAVGHLPPTAGVADSIEITHKELSSATGLYTWTAVERSQGTPVCIYSRTEAGELTTTCAP